MPFSPFDEHGPGILVALHIIHYAYLTAPATMTAINMDARVYVQNKKTFLLFTRTFFSIWKL